MAKAQQQSNNNALPPEAEDMLLGRMRDQVLDAIRPIVGWPKLKEAQQHKVNNGVEQACRQAIRDAAPVIAGRGFGTISTTVGDINTKGELVIAKVSAERTPENILGLAEAGRCTLVLVDPDVYMGARPAAVMKDQPDLMDGAETPEAKAKREAIDADAERAESEARARQFKQLDEAPPTIDNDSGAIITPAPAPVLLLGSMLSPSIKDAADRGVAHRQAGGARNIPKDLEGKAGEANAWLKGYDAAEAGATPEQTADVVQAEAAGSEVDAETGEVYHAGAKPPVKHPRGHRAKRAVETADA